PDINNTNLSIEGPGADKLTVRRSSGGFYRIFTFGAFAEVEAISGLTVSNGLSQNDGGAVSQTTGTLNVTDCAFTDNFSAGSGGAIASGTKSNSSFAGQLIVTNSSFQSNASANAGGAIAFMGSFS